MRRNRKIDFTEEVSLESAGASVFAIFVAVFDWFMRLRMTGLRKSREKELKRALDPWNGFSVRSPPAES